MYLTKGFGENSIFSLPLESPPDFGADFLALCGGFPKNEVAGHFCVNCGGNDWQADIEAGYLCCMECGYCDSDIRLHQTSRGDDRARYEAGEALVVENPDYLAPMPAPVAPKRRCSPAKLLREAKNERKRRKRPSAGYKRTVYFNERMAQWALVEPDIPLHDWDEIDACFVEFMRNKGLRAVIPTVEQLREARGSRIDACYQLTKEEISLILQSADTVKPTDHYFEIERGYFKRRYLEKWLRIRWHFCGKGTYFAELPVWVVPDLRSMFHALQPAFYNVVYDRQNRKSFPSYNFGICRLLDLCNQSHACSDFPMLKTKAKRRRLNEYWWNMCHFMQW